MDKSGGNLLDDEDLFAEVRKTVDRGQSPVVKIPIGAKIIRKKSGPTRKIPLGAPKHYFWKMKTPKGWAMRCRNPGCNVQLKRDDERLTCSERCRRALIAYCKLVLDVEEGRKPAQEFPVHLRTQDGNVRRVARAV